MVILKHDWRKFLKILLGFLFIFIIFQIINFEFGPLRQSFRLGQFAILIIFISSSTFLGRLFKKTFTLIIFSFGIASYFMIEFLLFRGHFWSFILSMKNSLLYLVFFGLVSLLLYFYIKSTQQKSLHFALWLFLGVILTVIFKSSILSMLK